MLAAAYFLIRYRRRRRRRRADGRGSGDRLGSTGRVTAEPRLGVGRAAVLGAVQGPTELLPVSSSAHLRIVPWLLGWDLDDVSAEDRKAFEVAVHGGAALALLIGQRRLIVDELRRLDGRRVAVIALSFLPAVAVGLALEEWIDRGSAARAPPPSA